MIRIAAVLLWATTATAEPTVHKIDAENVTLHVSDMGPREAEPVLLLTGGPGFASGQMLSTAEIVAETHRAILPDQRGTGKSVVEPFDPGQFSFESAIADLETIRETLGLETWTLLGHSWGGLLSMGYAAAHPERVDALILVSPAGIDSEFWSIYQQNIQANLTPADIQALQSIAPPTEQTLEGASPYMRELQRVMTPATMANRDNVEALRAELAEGAFQPMVTMVMQQHLMSYDLKPALADFDKPVTIIQGAKDPIGQETTQRILDTIERSERFLIEECGHWPFHETPEMYKKLVRSALAP